MASGPYFDKRRGTWSIQWKDGARWRRVVVVDRKPGWKPGDAAPKKPPYEATLAKAEYTRRELASGTQGSDWSQTVAAFLGEYERQRSLDRRPSTIRALKRAIGDFLTWCEARKVTLLCQVTPRLCQDYANHWREQGRGIAYVKLHKALLAPAWRRAARLGTLASNPWPAVEISGKHAPEKRESWTPEQFEQLVAACPPWLVDVLTLGCHTGLRITALIRLEWSHVAWAPEGSEDFGEITVPPELDKAGTGYRVPIHRKAHDVLFRRKASAPDTHPYVLANRDGKTIGDASLSFQAIHRACTRAGMPIPRSANHAMRRTFGRWAVLGHLTGEPIDIYTVSRWMGHKSIEMTQRYLDIDPKTSRESMRDKRQAS